MLGLIEISAEETASHYVKAVINHKWLIIHQGILQSKGFFQALYLPELMNVTKGLETISFTYDNATYRIKKQETALFNWCQRVL
ncbi:hypothetical protein [Vagococcus salmoninarum]|uniref:hypothetical protein n=1 Tax=Vagococcus salmoninarum TaxID=2739 RepID=UPI003F950F0D